MNYDSLSERQHKILEFIQAHQNETGFPPTIREIGEACHIPSTSVVNYNLNKLVDGGFITRAADKSRGIRLNKQTLRETPFQLVDETGLFNVPMVGKIVAGSPVWPGDSGSYIEETIAIPREMIGNVDSTQIYALRVSGHSMIDAMIADGDLVVLKRQEFARNGDMVAAWLTDRNETTLKEYYDEGARVRLQPRNPMMEPIYVDKGLIQIQGRVLAVFRKVN
jgi:repressor LexA